jgi:hypothetical protein
MGDANSWSQLMSPFVVNLRLCWNLSTPTNELQTDQQVVSPSVQLFVVVHSHTLSLMIVNRSDRCSQQITSTLIKHTYALGVL